MKLSNTLSEAEINGMLEYPEVKTKVESLIKSSLENQIAEILKRLPKEITKLRDAVGDIPDAYNQALSEVKEVIKKVKS